MTVTFMNTGKQSGFFHSFNNNAVGGGLNPNWEPFTYSNVNGGLMNTVDATAEAMHSLVLWTGVPPAGSDRLHTERQLDFAVTGSGTVTLLMDYTLNVQRDVDPAQLPYPFVMTEGVLDLSMYIFTPGFNQQGTPVVSRLNRTIGGIANQEVRAGTISVSMPLTSGTYIVRADTVTTVAVSVPEPDSFAMLTAGLLLITVLSRSTLRRI